MLHIHVPMETMHQIDKEMKQINCSRSENFEEQSTAAKSIEGKQLVKSEKEQLCLQSQKQPKSE